MKKNFTFLALSMVLLPSLATPMPMLGQHNATATARLANPHHQAALSALSAPYFGIRYWDKGYLVTYESDGTSFTSPTKPAVLLYDKDGRVAREAIVWPKDARSATIGDAAATRSGKIIVAGGAEDSKGVIANFIATIDDSGHMSQTIRTTPFIPALICSADDGTVWSYGMERDAQGRGVQTSLRLRQYSFDKGELSAMLDVSSLNSDGWKLKEGRYPGEISLRCTSSKVGLLNGASSEFVEFDLAANKLKVSKVEPLPPPEEVRITGFALTESGDVFVSLHDHSTTPSRSGLFKLSFDKSDVGAWVPVDNTVGRYLHGAKVDQLLGADGSDLVYTRDLGGSAYWSKFTK